MMMLASNERDAVVLELGDDETTNECVKRCLRSSALPLEGCRDGSTCLARRHDLQVVLDDRLAERAAHSLIPNLMLPLP